MSEEPSWRSSFSRRPPRSISPSPSLHGAGAPTTKSPGWAGRSSSSNTRLSRMVCMSSAIRRVRKSARRPSRRSSKLRNRFASARLPFARWSAAPRSRRRSRRCGALAGAGNAHRPSSEIARLNRLLAEDHETARPAARARRTVHRPRRRRRSASARPAILPTGRNLHGFDPYRIPSAFAIADGARQAERVLARYASDGHPFPESVAIVLWGTDNLKSEGGPIGQALALIGARPRFDAYGRLSGASAGPPRRARPAAHRHRRHGVRNLPRPPAVASPASGGSVLPGRHSGRAAGQKLRAQACARTSGQERLRPRDSGACASSAMPRALTGRTSAC